MHKDDHRTEAALGWDDLRMLLALARAGTALAAARALGVQHSTVLRRLDAAEERLGTRLFDRSRNGLTPTAAGRRLADAAARMEVEHLDAERAVAGDDLRPEGLVRIAAPDTVLDFLVLPILVEVRRRHPGIQFAITLSNSDANLSRREADIAVRPTRTPPETAVGRQVATVAIAPYGAAPCDWRANDRLWVGPDESLDRYPVTAWMGANVPDERVVVRTNSVRAMADAARAGFGLAALPCFLGDATPGLVRVGDPLPELESPLWLLTHADLRDAARIRVVLDALGAGLTDAAPRIAGARDPS